MFETVKLDIASGTPRSERRRLSTGDAMFRGCDLVVAHSEFPFKFDKKKPHVSRFDAICSISVAFLWESASARMDGCARVYFSDGVLHLDGRMRDALPKGQRAVHPETFIDVVSRFPPGVRFRKFGPIGSVGSDLSSAVRDGGRRLYLVLDDKGAHLETRQTCSAPTLARCPRCATFVLGGTRGYSPYTADAVATFIREGGSTDVYKVAFGSRQQHASQIVSHLRAMDDDSDLRNACALTFYTKPGDAEMNTVMAEIVGADADLQGLRRITILPTQSPPTTEVKHHFRAPRGRRLGRCSGKLKCSPSDKRGGVTRIPKLNKWCLF